MLAFVRTHKTGVAAAAIVATAGLAWLAFGFFGIHTMFIDDVVDEGGPVFDAAPAAVVESAVDADAPSAAASIDEAEPVAAPATTAPPAPSADDTTPSTEPSSDADTTPPPTPTAAATPEVVTEFVGTFSGRSRYDAEGVATVLGNGTGQRFLRFENFATDNGPDLNVYLFNPDDPDDFIDLGDLKGNIGDQNYEIPADVDLSVYSEVSIWCVRFGVGFGTAPLMPT